MNPTNSDTKRYFFFGLILVLIFLSYLVIKPFIIPLISAFILAYLTKPLYDRLTKKANRPLSAILCILLVILLIILPLGALTAGIINQASTVTNPEFLSKINAFFQNTELINNLDIDVQNLTNQTIKIVVSLFTTAAAFLPSILIALLITFFAMYYILINWNLLTEKAVNLIPSKNKKQFSKEIALSTRNIVYGTILIALIEFVVSVVGFYFSGVDAYLFLPALIFFSAFIPAIGPAIIWVPTALYLIFAQNIPGAIGVIITGVIVSFGIDNLLRIKLVGDKSNIHPMIMLLGVFGGIPVFGIFGFIIGPIILLYTLKIVEEIMNNHQ